MAFKSTGLNPYANGAGVVLPDSGALDDVIKDVKENGLLNLQANKQQIANQAQANKDFATNRLNVSPTSQYQPEINALAQKWYDKGVAYRQQGFDPWNANWADPKQAQAAQEYLNEKKHIEDLAGLAKEVSTNYDTNQKLVQENKLDGWEDYTNAIKNTPLQDLYTKGGVSALPMLHKPFDLNEVDKNVGLKPQTRQIDEEVAPGVTNTVEHKYVDMPKAAFSVEQGLNNAPGSLNYFNKKGIGDPRQLYTYGGANMIRDPNNPEDFGHIDEPGIFHQIVHQSLTDPNQIKDLPVGVKKRIVASTPGMSPAVPLWTNGKVNTDAAATDATQKPYNVADDPEFQKYINNKFDNQIAKERGYQGEIINGIARQASKMDLGDKSKLDATMANLALRKESVAQGWARVGMEKTREGRLTAEWNSRMQDVNSRKKWVQDIQDMNPDAIKSLDAAISEVGGRIEHTNSGISVYLNEKVPNPAYKGSGDLVNPQTIYQEHKYDINDSPLPKELTGAYPKSPFLNNRNGQQKIDVSKYSGRSGRMIIEQILNKLPSVGKEKVLKTEEYNPDYNDIGTSKTPDTADDL